MEALSKHPQASAAIHGSDIRDRVVQWKSQFFASAWAHYDEATPGTFRLVPPARRVPALRRDYQSMRDMYLTEPPGFDEIMEKLMNLNGESMR